MIIQATANKKEIFEIISLLSTYQALKTEQICRLFIKKEPTAIRLLLKKLIRQKRIFYDGSNDIVKYSEDCETNLTVIACFWVLLDFIDKTKFHSISDYPAVLCFFAREQMYEVVYVPKEQEIIINCAYHMADEAAAKRIVVVDSCSQISLIDIPNTAGYCTVKKDGGIEYYQVT